MAVLRPFGLHLPLTISRTSPAAVGLLCLTCHYFFLLLLLLCSAGWCRPWKPRYTNLARKVRPVYLVYSVYVLFCMRDEGSSAEGLRLFTLLVKRSLLYLFAFCSSSSSFFLPPLFFFFDSFVCFFLPFLFL